MWDTTVGDIVVTAVGLFAVLAGSLFTGSRVSLFTSEINARVDGLADVIQAGNARLERKLDRIRETLAIISEPRL